MSIPTHFEHCTLDCLKHIIGGTIWSSFLFQSAVHVLFNTLLCSSVRAVGGYTLGRNRSKTHCIFFKSLPRPCCTDSPVLKLILGSIRLYRKACTAGIVKVSPSDAFKLQGLEWLRWTRVTREKDKQFGAFDEKSRNSDLKKILNLVTMC